MEVLWAPWRMAFIEDSRREGQCIFCPMDQTDEKRYILFRTPRSLVILNRFPYAHAHLMVAPVRHTAEVDQLAVEEMTDLFQNVRRSIQVLREVLHPGGFNVGMNLGQVAGAGILDHLHFHVVPRWMGDVNFMPLLAEVRVLPEHLEQTYRRLRPSFEQLGGSP